MKILKYFSLPLLVVIFSVSASPLSSIFAAEEEKHQQDARGLQIEGNNLPKEGYR